MVKKDLQVCFVFSLGQFHLMLILFKDMSKFFVIERLVVRSALENMMIF